MQQGTHSLHCTQRDAARPCSATTIRLCSCHSSSASLSQRASAAAAGRKQPASQPASTPQTYTQRERGSGNARTRRRPHQASLPQLACAACTRHLQSYSTQQKMGRATHQPARPGWQPAGKNGVGVRHGMQPPGAGGCIKGGTRYLTTHALPLAWQSQRAMQRAGRRQIMPVHQRAPQSARVRCKQCICACAPRSGVSAAHRSAGNTLLTHPQHAAARPGGLARLAACLAVRCAPAAGPGTMSTQSMPFLRHPHAHTTPPAQLRIRERYIVVRAHSSPPDN